jgi:hypothetical protein
MKIFYKTSATATGGRSGISMLDDNSFLYKWRHLAAAMPG